MSTFDPAQQSHLRKTSNDVDFRDFTDELIRSLRRLADLDHFIQWNRYLRHRVWHLHIKAELVGIDDEELAEVADYRAALDMLKAAL